MIFLSLCAGYRLDFTSCTRCCIHYGGVGIIFTGRIQDFEGGEGRGTSNFATDRMHPCIH